MMLELEFLDTGTIYSVIGEELSSYINNFEILPSVNSTNDYLLNKETLVAGTICLAEQQTAGRGRCGRNWLSPASGNLYLSLSWDFTKKIASLNGLTLVIGIAIINALNAYGLSRVKLKWPNDVYFSQRKLAGILVESAKITKNSTQVVIGIGLNIYMPQESTILNQPWIDVYSIEKHPPDRNRLAGLILRELFIALPKFQEFSLSAFRHRWQELDLLVGQELSIHTPKGDILGIGAGIDEFGNLLLRQGNTVQAFNSGEISVRFASFI